MEEIRKFVAELGVGLADFLERQAGHVCVLLLLVWWSAVLMNWHIDYGQRLMDQATGALMYAMSVRKPEGKD